MTDKRQIILDTAERLFYRDGYHAVGIDRIIAESGVAKMTLYKYFASKDDLIAAVLAQRDAQFRQSLFDFVADFTDPVAQIRAFFVWHDRWLNTPAFHGCMFIHAAAEFGSPDHPAYRIAQAHKHAIRDRLCAILSALCPPEAAAQTAAQLLQLLDGAVVSAFVGGDKNAALTAWHTADLLLAHLPSPPFQAA